MDKDCVSFLERERAFDIEEKKSRSEWEKKVTYTTSTVSILSSF